MLLANRTVAAEIGVPKGKRSQKAFVYRIHDQPDVTRLTDLAAIARNFGYKIKTTGTAKDINKSINRMLADVKGKGEENLLSLRTAIRSMAEGYLLDRQHRTLWSGIRLLHPTSHRQSADIPT